ncbi:hypothetical protein PV328_007669 [Microctonus aethiopoides]|uniref:Uncharacterized protein n=1 Tax=Microctonus aethiopoides TaxID=144406 RepID=A0AA39C973_9HYME|nr:hypothetical protein PV328_007669 [Microctonus aethiopoides]
MMKKKRETQEEEEEEDREGRGNKKVARSTGTMNGRKGGEIRELVNMIKMMRMEMEERRKEMEKRAREQEKWWKEEMMGLKAEMKRREEKWEGEIGKIKKEVKEKDKRMEEESIRREKEEELKEMERGWERMEREERRKNIGIRGLKGEEQEGSAKAREVLRELGVSEGIEEIEAVKGGRGMEVVKMKNAEEKKKVMQAKRILVGRTERVEDDLTWKERETKKKILNKVEAKRRKGHAVFVRYGRMEIDGNGGNGMKKRKC